MNWQTVKSILEVINPDNGFPLTNNEMEAIREAIKYGDRCAQAEQNAIDYKQSAEANRANYEHARRMLEQAEAEAAQLRKERDELYRKFHISDELTNLQQFEIMNLKMQIKSILLNYSNNKALQNELLE